MGAIEIARSLRAELSPRDGMTGPYQWGVVSATHASPPSVDVYLDGSATLTLGVRYLTSYEPVVNDTVLVARMSGSSRSSRVVLGSVSIAPRYQDIRVQMTNQSAGDTTVNTSSFTKVSLVSVGDEGDPLNMGNYSSFRTTITIPGMYLVSGLVSWQMGANAGRIISTIYKNGTELAWTRGSYQASATGFYNGPTQSVPVKCAANDYFELYAWQNSGVNTPVYKGQASDFCAMTVQFLAPV